MGQVPFKVLSTMVTHEELVNEVAKWQKLLRNVINGDIDFENIRVGGIVADRIDVDELSAISANLGTIVAGLLEAVTIIGSVITGSRIQTSESSYPRVEINPTTTLIKAEQSATSRIEVAASHSGSSPAFLIYQGAGLKLQIQEIGGDTVLFATVSGDDLQLSSSKDLYLNGTKIRINASSDILINGTPGYTGTVSSTDTLIVNKGLITGKL